MRLSLAYSQPQELLKVKTHLFVIEGVNFLSS